jgi:hypothetical protein
MVKQPTKARREPSPRAPTPPPQRKRTPRHAARRAHPDNICAYALHRSCRPIVARPPRSGAAAGASPAHRRRERDTSRVRWRTRPTQSDADTLTPTTSASGTASAPRGGGGGRDGAGCADDGRAGQRDATAAPPNRSAPTSSGATDTSATTPPARAARPPVAHRAPRSRSPTQPPTPVVGSATRTSRCGSKTPPARWSPWSVSGTRRGMRSTCASSPHRTDLPGVSVGQRRSDPIGAECGHAHRQL